MVEEYTSDIIICGPLEHPPTGFQLYSAAATSSKAERRASDIPKVDTLLEDDILKATIPVVRDVVGISPSGPRVLPH
jgi:hypothetical protein